MPTKVEFKNVYKIFGKNADAALAMAQSGSTPETIREQTGATVALNNIDLAIEDKEICVVMGLSGSGKSTLIRLVNRLITPTSGSVLVNGQNVGSMSAKEIEALRRNTISMVFQNFALLPHKTTLDNTTYGLELRGENKRLAREKAADWLTAVGLQGFENAYPSQLSGGMKQRVGLARALATDAEILLMDEPYSALDPLIRREMQDQLKELQTKLKKTILFITHDLNEALMLGDQVAILRAGAIIQKDAPQQIITNPADDYVRRFVSASAPKHAP